MEWVETTAKSLEEAKELALDQLGVAADEAQFEILEEPRPGLFGRSRGEARVRARVMPAAVRPKHDRKRSRGGRSGRGGKGAGSAKSTSESTSTGATPDRVAAPETSGKGASGDRPGSSRKSKKPSKSAGSSKEQQVNTEDAAGPTVTPEQVGAAAQTFMDGLTRAFGASGEAAVSVEGTEIDVRVTGSELGLMVGHGGRTLTAIQDLARVASQRRLGDHDTRLRVDVAGYREKRRAALEQFALSVANQVKETGSAKALEPMQSADRKVVHDALTGVDGVASHSEGDDPMRRVVITPG